MGTRYYCKPWFLPGTKPSSAGYAHLRASRLQQHTVLASGGPPQTPSMRQDEIKLQLLLKFIRDFHSIFLAAQRPVPC